MEGVSVRRYIRFLGILALILGGLLFYFRPVPLADVVGEGDTVYISVGRWTYDGGVPDMELTDYGAVSGEQKNGVLSLLKEYPCRRSLGTPFSDGSIEGAGDEAAYIFVYDGGELAHSVCISSSGKCSVDDRTYGIENGGG